MSTQASPSSSSDNDAPLYRKPRADVFTVLLVISLLALILATSVLWLVMGQYDYSIKGGPSPVSIAPHAHPMVAEFGPEGHLKIAPRFIAGFVTT